MTGPARGGRGDRSGPRAVLLLCVGSYFAVRFAQVAVGALAPSIIDAFGFSNGSLGAALTGMWVAYALVQLPSGLLADRFGERRAVLVALGTTAAAAGALAAAANAHLFRAGLVALGVGAGLYYNPATSLLDRAFESVGGVVGTHRLGGQVAGTVAPLGVTAVLIRYEWRAAFLVGTGLAVSMAAVFFRRVGASVPPGTDEANRASVDADALAALATRSHTRYTTLMAALVEFAGLASMSFLPVFLVEHGEFSDGTANVLLAGYFAVIALTQPVSGRLSDRVGRDPTIAVQATAGGLGYAILAAGVPPLAAPGVVLSGAGVGSISVIQSRMLDGLSESDRGAGFGLFRTVYLLAGASGTAVVGLVADAFGWGAAFGALAVVFAVLLGCVAAVRRA